MDGSYRPAARPGCGVSVWVDLPGCPSHQSNACPGNALFAYRFDESSSVDCGGGYDQRNCDPAAPRYACGDGGFIAWMAVCDGSPDCENEADEFRCGPASGKGERKMRAGPLRRRDDHPDGEPGHCATILGPRFEFIGVGYHSGELLTQTFVAM